MHDNEDIDERLAADMQLLINFEKPKPPTEDDLYKFETVEIGQWFWKVDQDDRWNKAKQESELVEVRRLYCIIVTGTNYIELKSPEGHECRVHLDDFYKTCEPAPDHAEYIQAKIQYYQNLIRQDLKRIRGMTTKLHLTHAKPADETTQASSATTLTVLSGVDHTAIYKQDLIKAKETDIPAIKENIQSNTRHLSTWLEAETITLSAQVEVIDKVLKQVDARIFDLSIYAGLSESVLVVKEGAPASADDKLHLMQTCIYMDEECLAAYKQGGITCRELGDFDNWMLEDGNWKRLLPFNKCMAAFQVRRFKADREADTLAECFINMRLADADKYTYLYVRNGEALYCISSEFDYGYYLFPDPDEINFTEEMMGTIDCYGKVTGFMSKREYEDKMAKEEERKRNHAKWMADNKKAYRDWNAANKHLKKDDPWWIEKNPYHEDNSPYRGPKYRSSFDERTYEPFNDSSVYFDDMNAHLQQMIRAYNRVSLIIQGLFDRSDLLKPHYPVRLWDASSVEQNIELIYDTTNTLHHGDPPDIAAYMRPGQELIKKGTACAGVVQFWKKHESSWKTTERGHRYRKNGGPSLISRPTSVRNGIARFEFLASSDHRRGLVKHSLNVPVTALLNAETYKLGDFKQFYADPRTRRGYLQWAPFLIVAEEFQAGVKKDLEKKAENRDDDW